MHCAKSNVGDFIVKDSFQHPRAGFITKPADAFERGGGHIQPARLQNHGHNRQPRGNVVGGFLGGFP